MFHHKLAKDVIKDRIPGLQHLLSVPNLCLSPLEVIPKKIHSEYRIVYHMSYLQMSINDVVDPYLFSITCDSFDAVTILVAWGSPDHV